MMMPGPLRVSWVIITLDGLPDHLDLYTTLISIFQKWDFSCLILSQIVKDAAYEL